MKCPFCRSPKTDVYNTRRTKGGEQLWRRRRCLSCSQAFTTYEFVDLGFLQVSSKNDAQGPYARHRLYSALASALGPNDTTADAADALLETVESRLLDLKSPTITTADIVAAVLTTLKAYSMPAYLRYLAEHAPLVRPADVKRYLK